MATTTTFPTSLIREYERTAADMLTHGYSKAAVDFALGRGTSDSAAVQAAIVDAARHPHDRIARRPELVSDDRRARLEARRADRLRRLAVS